MAFGSAGPSMIFTSMCFHWASNAAIPSAVNRSTTCAGGRTGASCGGDVGGSGWADAASINGAMASTAPATSLARSQFFMLHPPFSHDRRRSGPHVAPEWSLAGVTVLHLRSNLSKQTCEGSIGRSLACLASYCTRESVAAALPEIKTTIAEQRELAERETGAVNSFATFADCLEAEWLELCKRFD